MAPPSGPPPRKHRHIRRDKKAAAWADSHPTIALLIPVAVVVVVVVAAPAAPAAVFVCYQAP